MAGLKIRGRPEAHDLAKTQTLVLQVAEGISLTSYYILDLGVRVLDFGIEMQTSGGVLNDSLKQDLLPRAAARGSCQAPSSAGLGPVKGVGEF